MTDLKSTIDGHPYVIADNDSWMRSKNKNYKRKVASRLLALGRYNAENLKTLLRIATRIPKRQR